MPQDQMLLAVLIDADNIPAKHAGDILREITTYGEPALRRVYGDWSSPALGNWKKVVVELGMVANQGNRQYQRQERQRYRVGD